MGEMEGHLLELIRVTSSDLPKDVEDALRRAREAEEPGSRAGAILGTILENVEMARSRSTPVCQDTGLLSFFVKHPPGESPGSFRSEVLGAVAQATEKNYLRPNAVHPVTGKNTGNNAGDGLPLFTFEEGEPDVWEVSLLLKGGGSENVSAQFKLPDGSLKAGRDLEGVRRTVLKAVMDAQGLGCAPGVLGVGIGGDRTSSFSLAKKQLLRLLTDRNPDGELASLEARLLEEANRLSIGPMGLGGKTTILGVKAATAHRHPASYFVSVAYLCWAARRKRMVVNKEGVFIE
ncbi:MAG: fumarate hydratase [Planctomycetota bacterium]|jgi:fumarate hydratase class I